MYAHRSMHYDWAVYSFSNGHFSSLIESHGLPFTIRLACDTSEAGCSLFNEFAPKATVFSSGNDLLNHIRASGHQSVISGYLINSDCFGKCLDGQSLILNSVTPFPTPARLSPPSIPHAPPRLNLLFCSRLQWFLRALSTPSFGCPSIGRSMPLAMDRTTLNSTRMKHAN